MKPHNNEETELLPLMATKWTMDSMYFWGKKKRRKGDEG